VPVWYVAPLEMNEGTHWGQGYNQSTKGCSAEERPNKRPLTLTLTLTSCGTTAQIRYGLFLGF
jgi:hypothetical protein